jgi:hypothetical protein
MLLGETKRQAPAQAELRPTCAGTNNFLKIPNCSRHPIHFKTRLQMGYRTLIPTPDQCPFFEQFGIVLLGRVNGLVVRPGYGNGAGQEAFVVRR